MSSKHELVDIPHYACLMLFHRDDFMLFEPKPNWFIIPGKAPLWIPIFPHENAQVEAIGAMFYKTGLLPWKDYIIEKFFELEEDTQTKCGQTGCVEAKDCKGSLLPPAPVHYQVFIGQLQSSEKIAETAKWKWYSKYKINEIPTAEIWKDFLKRIVNEYDDYCKESL